MAISCAVNLILIDHLKNNEVDVIQQTILGSRMEALELTNPASSYNKQGNLLLFHYVTILCMLKLSREREKQTERETERERQLYKTNQVPSYPWFDEEFSLFILLYKKFSLLHAIIDISVEGGRD